MGYSVSGKAKNEAETVHAIATDIPDLILMDIGLGDDTDGILLSKKILKDHNVPIVFLTGHTDGDTIARVKEVGPSGFIIKPFNDRDLQVSIELAINRKG